MRPLRALLIEDSEDDALLVQGELVASGFKLVSRVVETAADLHDALATADWDLVISDYSLPQFDALDALDIVHSSRQSELPFVIVSGSIGEASVVAALKAGASSYLMKSNLAQLLPIIERELKDAQTRRERKQAFAALERAVKARDEFLSIASHELKTPLTSLRLNAQSLLRAARRQDAAPLTSAQVLGRLESIDRDASRLTDLIERLLDITRIATGQLALSCAEVDLGQLVRDVVSRMADVFAAAGCEVSVRAAGPVAGSWDRDRLDSVVSNLLGNAAKFGPCGPIQITVEDLGDYARLEVIDDGIGVPIPDRERIFERFERAVQERHYGGFGAGLWLSRQIVHAHQGTIEVVASAARGATFCMTLPKRMAPS
ncbi:MAG: HAMP domain-containing histidine kinase [Myxococcota bacterium]|nr:HAMP domain-containing histidine kinase [Myxococcota bacterium]